MFDLSRITNEEDRTLISESIQLCEQKFFRASYIMAWLACIESLKRKFRELGKKDSETGKITTQIKHMEEKHESIEKYVIDKAKECLIIDEIEKTKLEYFWDMRSVYSHPYEQNPNCIDCEHIITTVISIVLEKALLIREGILAPIIKRLAEEKSYIDDSFDKVNDFISELFERVDPNCYQYFWNKIVKELENTPIENSDSVQFRRLIYVLKSLLNLFQINKFLISEQEIEDFLYNKRKTSFLIFSEPQIFQLLSERCKSIFFKLLIENKEHSKLNILFKNNLLNNDQVENLKTFVKKLPREEYINYSAILIIDKVIQQLKTYNFNIQNTMYSVLIAEEFVTTLQKCSDAQIIELGRNILQSADVAWSLQSFLTYLDENVKLYPLSLLKGIFFEAFINEKKHIRPKLRNLNSLELLSCDISEENMNQILKELNNLISHAKTKTDDDWHEITNTSAFIEQKNKILNMKNLEIV